MMRQFCRASFADSGSVSNRGEEVVPVHVEV
jgi:hypothetical protein